MALAPSRVYIHGRRRITPHLPFSVIKIIPTTVSPVQSLQDWHSILLFSAVSQSDPPVGKRVRFGLNDRIYRYPDEDSPSPVLSSGVEGATEFEEDTSPPPLVLSSPSPTHSHSTDGPFTPPSAPYASLDSNSKEPQNEDKLQLHPAVLNPDTVWDMFKRPTKEVIQELILYANDPFVVRNLHELTSIELVHPRLPSWPIRIDLGEPLTVQAVYTKIYRHLNEPLNGLELGHYGRRDEIPVTYTQRCQARRLDTAKEVLRRIDCMGYNRAFHGLRGTKGDPQRWELFLLSKAVYRP